MTDGVALAHDYATQRGGAERVALLLAQAFPGSPLYTTLYDPAGTFPEFGSLDVRPGPLNRVAPLRHHHRAALPFLAPAVSTQKVDADVLVASSTGWAHGYRGARRTVVYCHAPARWLYQRDKYLSGDAGARVADRARHAVAGAALGVLASPLRAWDRRAAAHADVYLVNSTVTQRAVRAAYGIEAEVLAPPPALLPTGDGAAPARAVDGIAPGYVLCVARLLPYKNVDLVLDAVGRLGDRRLVVVGDGPDRARLEGLARAAGNVPATSDGSGGGALPGAGEPRVRLLGRVDDAELRWLYENAGLLAAASYEDYGLSPLEAGAFGVPTVALRDGGYLDTVADGVNGVFFDAPDPVEIASALDRATTVAWDDQALAAHVARFGTGRFLDKIRAVVEQQRHDG
ncbi:glycosyltransferase [Luteimicrobium subarcticum]|uniref:D-inositol 3-phosphate glycosyltransferase n=1 Tax=Luteimicrobium subarcticum TaxID=620910 RepID=A0A2M8WTB4_9MICO|nr:glycosyltransferase [Luteimicrobium subarcticum]PJI94096.1 glycosyltransferase involved in cell wall biosynthesis [Luteimicrobium subarcticum]